VPIAIDGSNLGGALGGRRGARDARAVVEILQPWVRSRQGRVVLVFDGPARADVAERYGPIEIRWSGAQSADAVLLRLIARDPVDWWVVTNDRALAARCREAGARALPVAELLRRADNPRGDRGGKPATPRTKPDTQVDVAFWERFFRGEVE
jgi:hypothetical protein